MDSNKFERLIYYSPVDKRLTEEVKQEFPSRFPTIDIAVAETPDKLKQAVESFEGSLFLWFAGIKDYGNEHRIEGGISAYQRRSLTHNPYSSGQYAAIFVEGEEQYFQKIVKDCMIKDGPLMDFDKKSFEARVWSDAHERTGIMVPLDDHFDEGYARSHAVSDDGLTIGKVRDTVMKAYADHIITSIGKHEAYNNPYSRIKCGTLEIGHYSMIINHYCPSLDEVSLERVLTAVDERLSSKKLQSGEHLFKTQRCNV